jgi:hypothetical protein
MKNDCGPLMNKIASQRRFRLRLHASRILTILAFSMRLNFAFVVFMMFNVAYSQSTIQKVSHEEIVQRLENFKSQSESTAQPTPSLSSSTKPSAKKLNISKKSSQKKHKLKHHFELLQKKLNVVGKAVTDFYGENREIKKTQLRSLSDVQKELKELGERMAAADVVYN